MPLKIARTLPWLSFISSQSVGVVVSYRAYTRGPTPVTKDAHSLWQIAEMKSNCLVYGLQLDHGIIQLFLSLVQGVARMCCPNTSSALDS